MYFFQSRLLGWYPSLNLAINRNNISMKILLDNLLMIMGTIIILAINLSCDLDDEEKGQPPAITWQQIGAFEGQIISVTEASPNGGLFVSTSDSGIMVSFDEGYTWETRNNGIPAAGYYQLSINGQGHLFASWRDTLFRSMDDGNTWLRVLKEEGQFGPVLATGENIVLVGILGTGSGRMLRSMDNGTSWTTLESAPFTAYRYLSFIVLKGGEFLLGTNGSGVYKSQDDGNSWTSVTDLSDFSNYAFAASRQGELYGGGSDGSGSFQGGWVVLRSDDQGRNWELYADFNDWIYDLKVNENGNVFIATGKGVFRFIDSAGPWEQLNDGLPAVRVLVLAIDLLGYIYAGTYGEGLFRSSKPTTY